MCCFGPSVTGHPVPSGRPPPDPQQIEPSIALNKQERTAFCLSNVGHPIACGQPPPDPQDDVSHLETHKEIETDATVGTDEQLFVSNPDPFCILGNSHEPACATAVPQVLDSGAHQPNTCLPSMDGETHNVVTSMGIVQNHAFRGTCQIDATPQDLWCASTEPPGNWNSMSLGPSDAGHPVTCGSPLLILFNRLPVTLFKNWMRLKSDFLRLMDNSKMLNCLTVILHLAPAMI